MHARPWCRPSRFSIASSPQAVVVFSGADPWQPARLIALCATLALSTLSVARGDEIDDYVKAQMERQHVPGLALAVLKDGSPVKLKGYGVTNMEAGTPVTPESVFQIGSISKQFIAAAVLRLAEAGKVGLDDSIRKHLPDAPETWQPITLRHLLTHTSGLVRETPDLQLKVQSDMDAIRSAYPIPLVFAPGEKWQYSNLGYFALAEVITRAAQSPWPQYVHDRIFAPLEMNSTRTTDGDASRRVTGYQWMDTQRFEVAPSLPGVRPSGAFVSNLEDLIRWDTALSSDTVFTDQQRGWMWTPVKLNDGSEKPYGFGWEVGKLGKHRQVKHAGTMLGFRSQFLRLPDDHVSIIVLTNATQAVPEKIALGVAALVLPDLTPAESRRGQVELSSDLLEAYTGQYQVNGGRILRVRRVGHHLAVSMPLSLPGVGKESAALLAGVSMDVALLTAESDDRFYDQDDPRATYVFTKTADGLIQLSVLNPEGKVVQQAKLAPK